MGQVGRILLLYLLNAGLNFAFQIYYSVPEVVGITTVDTIDEAIELANATEYSLTSSLWTRDANRALDVAARIRAGDYPCIKRKK